MLLVDKVLSGLWRLRFPSANANAYLIEQGGRLAFVDGGTPGTLVRLKRAVRAVGYSPADVSDVLVTHYHWDHAGNLAPLAAAGVRVWIHEGDAPVVRAGAPRPAGVPRDLLAKAIIVASKPVARDPTTPVAIHREIGDAESLPVLHGVRAVHLPGHTSGHTGFLFESRGWLFAGDALRNDLGRVGYSVTHEDEAQARRSIRRMAGLEFEACFFGHGPPVQGPASRRLRRRFEELAEEGPEKDGRG